VIKPFKALFKLSAAGRRKILKRPFPLHRRHTLETIERTIFWAYLWLCGTALSFRGNHRETECGEQPYRDVAEKRQTHQIQMTPRNQDL